GRGARAVGRGGRRGRGGGGRCGRQLGDLVTTDEGESEEEKGGAHGSACSRARLGSACSRARFYYLGGSSGVQSAALAVIWLLVRKVLRSCQLFFMFLGMMPSSRTLVTWYEYWFQMRRAGIQRSI